MSHNLSSLLQKAPSCAGGRPCPDGHLSQQTVGKRCRDDLLAPLPRTDAKKSIVLYEDSETDPPGDVATRKLGMIFTAVYASPCKCSHVKEQR